MNTMNDHDWRQSWAGNVCTPDDAARFVAAVGCCTLDSLPGYPDFPTQAAVMGPRPAGTEDPWFWKDDLHAEKRLFYTRVFGGRPGYLSYALLPALIATNGAVADELLLTGGMPHEAQEIYRAIEAYGPIPIKRLKAMLSPGTKACADRVLIGLERQFIITKTGISGRTMGTYGYIWDLVERWVPEMLVAADRLGRTQAQVLLREHLTAFGIPHESLFYRKVLGW